MSQQNKLEFVIGKPFWIWKNIPVQGKSLPKENFTVPYCIDSPIALLS
jgi:hypothetical protein